MSQNGPNMSQHKPNIKHYPLKKPLKSCATDIDDAHLVQSFSTASPQVTRFLPEDRPPG